jgi:hypothetical protein
LVWQSPDSVEGSNQVVAVEVSLPGYGPEPAELVKEARRVLGLLHQRHQDLLTYTFAIDGGLKSFPFGYGYSGFGPTASAEAVPNLTSLGAYLQVNDLNLPQRMRSLMSPQTSLRKFMKLT